MRTSIVIPLAVVALVAILYFSDQYDRTANEKEITQYQCEKSIGESFKHFFNKKELEGKAGKSYILSKKKNHLMLKNTVLKQIPEQFFREATCLKSINLDWNDLTTIPNGLQYLSDLNSISLEYNQITTLNTTAFSESSLFNSFNFSNNPIKALTIPPTKSYPEVFICNNCQLETIDTIHRTYIRNIQLKGNYFTQFPLELLANYDLRTLNLSENNITSFDLPKGQISSLHYTDLNELNLAKNQLTEFPEGIYRFPNLQTLYLENNQIAGEMNIKGLLYLKTLKITKQKLTSIVIDSVMYDNFGGKVPLRDFLPSTERIDLSSNKIEKFTILGKENNLTYHINLRNNHFKEFPNSLHKFKALRELDLSYNLFEKVVIEAIFEKELEILDLSYNQIERIIGAYNYDKHNEFQTINLSHNRLTIIPDNFLSTVIVNNLDLSSNNIKNMMLFEYNDYSWCQLRKLNLSNNPISSWDNSISKLTYLQELDLSNTDIEYIPFENIANLPFLNRLILKNTKIPKSTLKEMQIFLKEFDIQVVY